MHIDEGGIPTGGLSGYVSGRLAEAERQVTEEKDRARDAWFQRTAPLRTHLLELAKPLDELLARFRVREVLENAQVVLSERGGKVFDSYKVVDLSPRIYQAVILDPKAVKSIELEGGLIELDTLIDHNNFRRLFPRLEGYGLALSYERRTSVSAREERLKWVEAKSSHEGWSVGGGDRWSTNPAHMSWDYFLGWAPVRVTKSFQVEVEEAESGQGYDLVYSHQLKRKDLRSMVDYSPEHHRTWVENGLTQKPYIAKDDDPQDRHKYLTPPQKIHADDPVEIFIKLIGDDMIRELEGQHLDLLHQFKTRGTVRERREPARGSSIPFIDWIPFKP